MRHKNCVDIIKKKLNKTTNEESRSNLIYEIKDCWDKDNPEREIFRLINEILLDEKEFEKVKITSIDVLKELGFIVFDLEFDYKEFDTDTANTLNKILKLNKMQNNKNLIASVFTLLEKYSIEVLGILDEQDADPRITANPNYYIKILYSILENTYDIPALNDNTSVIKNSLDFWSRYLDYVKYWQAKFPNFQYNINDLWSNIEEKMLFYIKNKNEEFKEIRKKSAFLIQSYGKHKGEEILRQAIIDEKYIHVKIELIKALAEIALQEESHFVFIHVMQKGTCLEKEQAGESLTKFAKKLGYNNGNELIEKFKPRNIKPMDTISLAGSIFALVLNTFTILGIIIEYNLVNYWTIILVILSPIIMLGLIDYVIITPKIQENKYNKKLKKWKIEKN